MGGVRPLGYSERYALARTNIGSAPILAFAARLSCPTSVQALRKAVSTLQARHLLLRTTIQNPTEATPEFSLVRPNGEPLVHLVKTDEDAGFAPLLSRGLAEGEGMSATLLPLWRVTLFHGVAEDRLLLVMNHVLTDGQGARQLVAELLELLCRPDAAGHAVELVEKETQLAPTLESTLDIAPSYAFLAKYAAREMLTPRLPSILVAPSPPSFPPKPLIAPSKSPQSLHLFSFPASVVSGLKSSGKSHKIQTLHPTLYICAVASLSLSLSPDDPPLLHSTTPISLRCPTAGHPLAAGNYVTAISSSHSLAPSTPFWASASSYAHALLSSSKREEAKHTLGLLAYLSTGELLESEGGGTGWEQFLRTKRDTGFQKEGLEVSNVGWLQGASWGGKGTEGVEVAWAQSASPTGAAITMNVITSPNGTMNISATWREGSVRPEVMDKFCATFSHVVEAVSNDKVAQEATFGTVLEAQ